jgi:RNA recognition motif-containing protein
MTARLVQVTNVSTSVTKDQLKSLFIHLGKIEEIQLYTESELISQTYNAKVGYIRFANSETAQAALNLTSTVFLDRPILCYLVQYPHKSSSSANLRIPEEHEAIKFCPLFNPNISLIPNGITWPNSIINRIVNTQVPSTSSKPASYIETIDPVLAERSLPPYPNLPGNLFFEVLVKYRRG